MPADVNQDGHGGGSACLLGEKVRYSGRAATCDDPVLRRWLADGRIVSFCPEVAGGLLEQDCGALLSEFFATRR